MPRIRTIKPEFFKHEDLFDLEQETGLPIRISFAGLWTCCDREGRFKWKPRQLKSDILPHDNVDFSRVLDALFTRGFIKKYRVESKDYGFIPTWGSHQVINNRESKSVLPEPSETFLPQSFDASSTRGARDDNASPTPLKYAQAERKGKERKGKEEQNHSARKARGVNNSQVSKAAGESRHSRLQQMVMTWYRDWAGVECPWDGSEGRNLKRLIDSTPNWPDQQFVPCLENVAASDCVPKGDRPREWIEKLPKFLHGPLDQYWKPKGNSNGNGSTSRATEKLNRNRQAIVSGLTGDSGWSDARRNVPDVQRNRTDSGAGVVLEGSPQRAKSATNS